MTPRCYILLMMRKVLNEDLQQINVWSKKWYVKP